MKIKKSPPKRLAPPHPVIQTVVNSLVECPEKALAATLSEFGTEWPFPRGDLFHYVPVLNRFDSIMSAICARSKITGASDLGKQVISPADKDVLVAILTFERLLLENCTNRNVYCSYEHLDSLMTAVDVDVVEATLRLLLRPAQRLNAQRTVRAQFSVSKDTILTLAQTWIGGEHVTSLAQVICQHNSPEREAAASATQFKFFRTARVEQDRTASISSLPALSYPPATATTAASAPPATPVQRNRSSSNALLATTATQGSSSVAKPFEGMTTITVTAQDLSGKSVQEVFEDLVHQYQIPPEYCFPLYCKLRAFVCLQDEDMLRKIVKIRMLAIAVMAHYIPESKANAQVFIYNQDLINQIVELIHPDTGVPYDVRTAALYAIDGVARYRFKMTEVLNALHASANHGVLLYAARIIVTDLASDKKYPYEFLEAFFAFLSWIVGTQTGGNMVISAGIVGVLAPLLENERPHLLKIVTKAASVLDAVIYGFTNSFAAFAEARGVETLVERIRFEVEKAFAGAERQRQLENAMTNDPITPAEPEFPATSFVTTDPSEVALVPHERLGLLRVLLKFVLHMMQTNAGNSVRNLIDSSIPKSLKRILESPDVFGASVYGQAINVMTTFIHNEPTSLLILQEAKLPEAFLNSVSGNIPASVDVISAVPNAFGAICLNPAGLEAFLAKNPLDQYFAIFYSQKYLRALQEAEVAAMVGSAVDELIRHQPALKGHVYKSILKVLATIAEMGERDTLEGDENLEGHVLHVAKADGCWDPNKPIPKDRDEDKESVCFPFMDVSAKFLEGFLQNASHCKDFVAQVGLAPLLRLFKIPRITHDFSMIPACFNLAHVVHVLSETCVTEVAQEVLGEFMKIYNQAKPYLESKSPESVFVELADLREDDPGKVAEVGHLYYALRALAGLSSLLSDVYVSPNFSSNKSFSAISLAFTASEGYLAAIGQLHRVALLEYEMIRIVVPPLPRQDEQPGSGKRKSSVLASTGASRPPVNDFVEHVSASEGDATAPGAASSAEATLASAPDAAAHAETKAVEKGWLKTPHKLNMSYFRILFSQINSALHHTLQGLSKMFPTARRAMDANNRRSAIRLANAMAKELVAHLTWERLGSHIHLAKAEYIVSVSKMISLLLMEEQQHNPLHTCLAVAFDNNEGLVKIFDAILDLWEQEDKLAGIAANGAGDDVIKAKEIQKPVGEAMDTFLGILHFLTSPKNVHESPLTSLLVGKEKDRAPGDSFDAYDWLVDLRMRVLPVVVGLWNSDSIRSRPSGVVRNIIHIVTTIVRAEGEVNLRGNSASLFTSALEATSRIFGGGAASRPQTVLPGPDRVQRLVDMGFVRAAAEAALVRTHNNISRAVEWLLTHPGAFANAPGAAAQPIAEPAGDAVTDAAVNTASANASAADTTGTVSGASSADSSSASSARQLAPSSEIATHTEQQPQALATTSTPSGPPARDNGAVSSAAAFSAQDAAGGSEGFGKAKEKDPLIVEAFEQLKTNFKAAVIPRAIELPDHVEDIMFDVKSLLLVAASGSASEIASALFNDVKVNYEAGKSDVVSNRLRLFALLLNEHGIDSAMLQKAHEYTPELLRMISQESQKSDVESVATWVASALLLLEALISHNDEPQPAEATYKKCEAATTSEIPSPAGSSQDTAQPLDATPTRPVFVDGTSRLQLVRDCVLLLKGDKLPRDTLLSVLRIVVRLTREHSLAVEFAKAGGISAILAPLKKGADAFQGQQSLIIMIMRHVIEDQDVLRQSIQREITDSFAVARSRLLDVNSYLRSNSHSALRSPEVFVEMTGQLCKIPRYDSSARNHQVVLKQDDDNEKADMGGKGDSSGGRNGEASGAVSADLGAGRKAHVKAGEATRGVVPYMISELLAMRHSETDLSSPSSAGSDSNVPMEPPSPTQHRSQEVPTPDKSTVESEAAENMFVYRCFLLQCLAEVFLSYPSCKLDVMNNPKRHGPNKEAHTPSKVRSTFIQHVLQELLPVNMTGSTNSPDTRRRAVLSVKAASVIVALCSGAGTESEEKEKDKEKEKENSKGKEKDKKSIGVHDASQLRKFVLDCISKALRDAMASSEPVEVKYGRFASLADLCYLILSAKSSMPGKDKDWEGSNSGIARLMLEKNIVAALTSMLSEIDLNFPQVNVLIGAVIKPLERLTTAAKQMGVTGEPISTSKGFRRRLADEMRGGRRAAPPADEETPDLYRNSALGIVEGGGNMDAESGTDSEEDQDAYDDDGGYADETGSDVSDIDEGDEDEAMEIVMDDDEGNEYDDDLDASEEEDDEGVSDEDGEDEGEDGDDDEMDDEMIGVHESEDEHVEGTGDEMNWETDEQEVAEDDIAEVYDDDHHHGEHDGDIDGGQDGHIHDHIDPYNNDVALFDDEAEDTDNDEDEGESDDADEFEIFHRMTGHVRSHMLDPMWNQEPGGGFIIENARIQRDVRQDAAYEALIHPLLVNRPANATQQGVDVQRTRNQRGGANRADWSAFGELIGGNAVQILGQLLQQSARSGGTYRLEVADPVTGHIVAGIDDDRLLPPPRHEQPLHPGTSSQDLLSVVKTFNPLTTCERWHQEARLMYGNSVAEKASRLANAVMNVLVPAAEEENRQRRLNEEAEAAEAARRKAETESEESAKKASEDGKLAEESAATVDVVTATSSTFDAPSTAAEPVPMETDTPAQQGLGTGLRQTESEAESVAVTSAETSAVETSVAEMSAAETAAEASGAQAEAGPSQPQPPRMVVVINGTEVDVADMGIDITFLEALPEEMRQEVVEQHLREQGRPIPRPQSAGISSEFLEALPLEIREEVLAEERMEQRVRELEERQRNRRTQDTFQPGEMDPATFLANMDPELRGAMLMGSDDVFLASLPPDLVAQAETLRTPRRTHPHRRLAGQVSAGDTSSKRVPQFREAVHLVDRSGLATLVRLLFLPQPPQKPQLHKLLLNLCENSKTRTELMSLLLSIIQDGGADFSAVDRSFSQMSVRGKAHATPGKPTPGKRHSLSEADSIPTEGIPNLVTQRCLEAISYLVTYNEQTTQYFLRENENVLLRRSNSKKGKGKEKASASNKYPIAVLLSLLERTSFPENSALMEQLMHLLSTICRLLPSIAKQELEEKKISATPSASEITSAPAIGESKSATSGSETPAAMKAPVKSEDESTPLRLPVIPEYCLKAVVNALTEGECSSKTFQCTLAVIQNLSALPGAKDVITAELTNRAQALGDSVKRDLVDLVKVLSKASSGIDVQGTILNRFTPASSDQARLLRVLKTIDYMYFPKPGAPTTPKPILAAPTVTTSASGSSSQAPAINSSIAKTSEAEKAREEHKASKIYEALNFSSMWKNLGDCLSLIHQKEDLMHVATVLLPIMESFMVMHKHISFKNAATMQRNASRIHLIGREASRSPEPQNGLNAEELFFQFTEDHRKILNVMVRKNPSLMSGSFSLLVHNPNVLEFENKRNYFNQQLHKRGPNREHYGTIQLNVRRQFVFEDSFHQLQGHIGNEVKYGKLSVRFYDEEGVDAGGVSREWFQVLARQMFNPDYALFISSAVKKVTYQPNRYSYFNPEHLLYFRFVGRIVGKAIFDGKLLDCYFTRSLYKHILGKPVDYRDVEALDPAYYQSLEWMLNNDITDVIDLRMTVEETEFGKEEIIELVPGGTNTPVTEENKREYIRLVSEHKLTKAIKDQIAAFKEGFHEIIPSDLVSIFDPEQLELMISGMPDINVEDWRANTEYEVYTASSPQIQWFWRAVRLFEQEERAKLLQFVTGTSRVPLEGFGALQGMNGVQKFSIRMDPSSPSRLPSAHTCFNSMDLPQYESYEQLRKQLLLAITEASIGFSFA